MTEALRRHADANLSDKNRLGAVFAAMLLLVLLKIKSLTEKKKNLKEEVEKKLKSCLKQNCCFFCRIFFNFSYKNSKAGV